MIRIVVAFITASAFLLGAMACTKEIDDDATPHLMTGLTAHGFASRQIPENILSRGYFNWFSYSDSVMTLVFEVPGTVTLKELGWQEGTDTEIENTGALPSGTFIELSFQINGYTGEILSKKASDNTLPLPDPPLITLGPGPGEKVWWQNAVVLAGTIIALALGLWILRRRRAKVEA